VAADSKPSTPSPGRGVAVELALLVAVVAVPLAGLCAFLLYDTAQRDTEHASGIARQLAATTADRAQRYVANVRGALEAIARRPQIRAMDPARCDPSLPDLLQLYPQAANILVVDLEGRMLCGAIPPPADRVVRISDDALLKEMIANPRFLLSRPLIGRISKRWTVTAVQPVYAGDAPEARRLVGTVSMAIDLQRWISFSGIEGLPEGGVMTIVTTDGVIVARSLDSENWVGTLRKGPIHDRMLEMKRGNIRAIGADGADRLWGFMPVPGADWFAVAGVPADQVLEPARVRTIGSISLILAVLAAAVSLAFSLARILARRVEGELRSSEARFSVVVDRSWDVFQLLGPDRRILYVSPSVTRILGYDPAEQVGRVSAEYVHPEDIERTGQLMGRLLSSPGESVVTRVRVRHKDGNWRWVESSATNLLEHPDVRAVAVNYRDITEQVKRDEELGRFRAAVDISGDAVVLIDRETLRYVDVNQTFCDMIGYARHEIVGKTPMDVFSADRATLERDYDAIIADRNSPASRIEGEYRRKDGTRLPVETRRRALRTAAGWIMVAIARDITGRKAAEERIARLNRVYAVLSGINAAIVRIQDRDELFKEACRIAVEHGQMRSAWMGVVDRDAQEVRVVACRGGDEDFVASLRGRTSMQVDAEGRTGIVAAAVIAKAAVVSNDVASDPRVKLQRELTARGIHSMAVLPIVLEGEVAAVLTLHAAEAGFFDDQEMKLLQELAGDIAFALGHIGQQEQLDYLAYYDSLTGLANRRLFVERLGQYLHSAGQSGDKLALVVADVERLRNINDSLGRQAGDALLRALAGRIAAGAERSEIARISADHFAIVLQGVQGRSGVTRRVERLWQDVFGAPFTLEGAELRVAGRGGIALFPNDGIDAETLMRNAEAALRRAKQTGERQVFHAREMTERSAEKLSLENRLRQALEKDEFVLHYQPKVDLETRRIVGVEALIRWQNPELGLVPPGQFIPLMEETGIILEAGAWAVSRAVQDHKRWLDLGLQAPRVAVNVSAVQLRKKDYLTTLGDGLKLGATPTGIDLEITESLVMEDIQGNIEKLKEARKLGVSIAIDDFGTGYSSLAYLAKLPVQTLKIDRSFIITMLAEPDTMTLVSTIISLAHSLELKVVAEGVDQEDQAKILRLLRCDEMQGYLFSRPVPFDDITTLLRKA
jgi:diguanylate cyclase (GGDEF)-like protein/PAS domain S-box-containing protein